MAADARRDAQDEARATPRRVHLSTARGVHAALRGALLNRTNRQAVSTSREWPRREQCLISAMSLPLLHSRGPQPSRLRSRPRPGGRDIAAVRGSMATQDTVMAGRMELWLRGQTRATADTTAGVPLRRLAVRRFRRLLSSARLLRAASGRVCTVTERVCPRPDLYRRWLSPLSRFAGCYFVRPPVGRGSICFSARSMIARLGNRINAGKHSKSAATDA